MFPPRRPKEKFGEPGGPVLPPTPDFLLAKALVIAAVLVGGIVIVGVVTAPDQPAPEQPPSTATTVPTKPATKGPAQE